MKAKKGKFDYMATKVNSEKAYDKLNWEFIRDMLNDIRLPANLVNIIFFFVFIEIGYLISILSSKQGIIKTYSSKVQMGCL